MILLRKPELPIYVFIITFFSLIIAVSIVFSQQPKDSNKLPADIQTDSQGITLKTSDQITRVEIWSERAIRVIHFPSNSKVTRVESLAVISKPEKVSWNFDVEKDSVMISTRLLKVRINKTTGQVSFFEPNGTKISEEKGTSLIPNQVGGIATYKVEQKFSTDPTEGIYGFGQGQAGVMNYQGEIAHLQQRNAFIGVPVMISSRGYGIFWDNPAVTDVNVNAGHEEIIPAMQLFDNEGKSGGLTEQYFEDNNFEKLTATRTGGAIDYNWRNEKLPTGITKKPFSIRFSGFVEAEKAEKYVIALRSRGSVNLWIDDELVISDTNKFHPITLTARTDFVAGKRRRIKLEFRSESGNSEVHLSWRIPVEKPEITWTSEAGDSVNYFFFQGSNLDDVITSYRRVTGTVPLFPKWTWGLWQSRERYQTQKELLDVLTEYRKRKIPLDGIVQDWQYWEPGKWGSHEFEKTRFPDPTVMVDEAHKQNAHIIVSVWPRFDQGTDALAELEKAGAIYPLIYPNVYPKGEGRWYDAFSSDGRRIYWKYINERLAKRGFDGWWLDASEAELGGKWGEMRDLKTAAGSGTKVFNAYPLMHSTGVYQGALADVPAKRPFILTRSAYAGQQRNGAVSWSGDIEGSWTVFRKQIPGGLNFVATGIPYWNTDIGGFFGGDPKNPEYSELFTRWFQFGAFNPLFRIHGTGNPKEIWRFDESTQKILIDYTNLRYQLLPYIYSTSWQVTNNNYTMMRPLVMDFRQDKEVLNIADQYMFGSSLLACPVTSPNVSSRSVYLPAGTSWTDFWTGKTYSGGQKIDAAAPIEMMPLFVKAGSILPYGSAMEYVSQKPADPIELRIYRGSDGSFTLYEDEGDNHNYEKGSFSIIPINWNEKKKTLTIGARQGTFPGMLEERTFRVVLVSENHGSGIPLTIKADGVIKYSGKQVVIPYK